MEIKAIKLRDWNFGNQFSREIEDRWDYADFLNDEHWRKDWISFDSLCYDPPTDTVFCGITSFAADIFWGWSRLEGRWVDAGYGRIRDRYDAKFHRALVRHTGNGCLYAAPALLHDINRFWEAPGASIVEYNPATNAIAKLGTPLPHVYIQSIVLDERRGAIYGQTFTPENLVSFNLKTRESRCLGPTSSGMTITQGENIALDDLGRVWGVWSVTRAWQSQSGADTYRFYRYDPRRDKIEYMDKGLPSPDGAYGYAKLEAFFNLGAGCLHASGENGAIYRIDPENGDAEFIGRPIENDRSKRRSRLASMCVGPDGLAYGITGRDGECEILQFDPRQETYKLLGPLKESRTGFSAWQIHDVCMTPGGVLYAAENDNPNRSGYLWEIKL